MAKSLTLFYILLLSVSLAEAQSDKVKFNTRIQLSIGGFTTDPMKLEKEITIDAPSSSGYQHGLQLSFCVPTGVFNFGIGAGAFYRPGNATYSSGLYPKAFLLMEVGNGTQRTFFSFTFITGVMQGSIQKNTCFYLGGGPSFNICKTFHPITFSISPYFEIHWGESKDITFWDSRHGMFQTYTFVYRTMTANISCIMQFNFFKKKRK